MFRKLWFIVMLMLILSAGSAYGEKAAVNGTLYTDEKTGLSLNLPSDISIISGSNEDEHDLLFLTTENITVMRMRISKSNLSISDPKTLVENITRTGNYSLIGSEKSEIAGIPGWMMEYTFSGSSGITYHARDIVATDSSSVYSVRVASPEPEYSKIIPVTTSILDSLTIGSEDMSRSALQYEGDPMGLQYWYYNKDQDLWTNSIPDDYSGWDTYYTEIADKEENLVGLFSYADDYPTTETLYGFQYNDPWYYPESSGSSGSDQESGETVSEE